jgi:hypothetical protein
VKRYVLYSEEWGVYLGSFMGLGFWTKLDPAGQDTVCVFSSPEVARTWYGIWDSGPPSLQVVEVECADPNCATVAECIAAGLPGWSNESPSPKESP